MGCISSKHVIRSSISPLHDYSLTLAHNPNAFTCSSDSSTLPNPNNYNNFGLLEKIKEETEDDHNIVNKTSNVVVDNGGLQHLNYHSNNKHSKKSAVKFSIRLGRSTVAEHVAAGWPAWLSAVAGEAIDGWLPLKSESFERFEKIGQGTYSSVYRARDLRTGRMMALKKVRFDNFQPESVRFMAREITILRKLDHPNIMKLEGIITSRLSCSVYLVFEYMEHDLAGLLSCPNIRFSDSQIKCYMKQLLKGIEHCHLLGILHRDIKTSNILVNNEGRLKIADFGLANFLGSRQPLTSRVVTLWYRPPELLLGSTDYGTYVDMWSVGCVFAELFMAKPILKGRTEVEQLHKIFKLCGNPPDEYWTNSTLPLATMFKPRHAYESSLRERCKELPKTAVNLIETFLSVEPDKRGSATSALQSKYFNTKPYACDPASLPKYPPSKEIDAKLREEAHRKKGGGRLRASGTSRKGRKTFQEQTTFCKIVPTETRRSAYFHGSRGSSDNILGSSKSYDTLSEVSQTTEVSQADSVCSLPAQSTTSNASLRWSTKRRKHVSFVTPTSQDVHSIEPIHVQDASSAPQMPENQELKSRLRSDFIRARHAMHKQRSLGMTGSLDSSEALGDQYLSFDHHEQERLRYTGPMLIQSHRTNGRKEGYTRNGVRRSRFSRDADL